MAKVYIADRYVQTLQGGWNLPQFGTAILGKSPDPASRESAAVRTCEL